jgi:GNAT superfamily N-acetyltransferase
MQSKERLQQLIRNASNEDLNALQEIKPGLDEEVLRKRVEMQAKDQARFLILEVENHPVAFVLLKWFGKITHPEYPDIEDLYTKASERGKGYASILIKECEKLARGKGFSKIGLTVNPDENDKAHKLYLKLGFKDTGEAKYVDGIYNGIKDWTIDMEKVI